MVARGDSVPADYGVGDHCYAVGLFILLEGTRENLAVVHTGHLALAADRKNIPVTDWLAPPNSGKTRLLYAHLVGLSSLEGLRGSPVFVRPPVAIDNVRAADTNSRAFAAQEDVKLLGIWQGSWRGEKLAIASAGPKQLRAQFGMGVVTPIGYLMEILENTELTELRRKHFSGVAAVPDAVTAEDQTKAAKEFENPSHREDFTSLLGEAARTPP